ncbi:hypothetical protein JOC86_001831 [Bacillus pakistanensis]|uniref:Uncharacterized protein n=1 Tax=Rossellomorea pakistanensis TaxID=992288 RepID=A0ABS2NBZ9_9BACI|nr:hypothetical protein [Bacillus pakistanensis]MBM7585289.1 hypothetical protein [Bacillus pakistanensis]
MNKKLFSILGGSALAAMLLVGCNVNDQEPPPEEEAPTGEEAPAPEAPAPEENGGMDEGNDENNDLNDDQQGNMNNGEDKNAPAELLEEDEGNENQ